jgi:hypothetical protein
MSNDDKLENVYNLGHLVERLKAHCIRYDMHDVFYILQVSPTDPKGLAVLGDPIDLFAHSVVLSNEDVAESNRWYKRWAKASWFQQNMTLSFELLQNNCTQELWEKCLERYAVYPIEQQGGPLMFRIIMEKLQSDTEQAVQHLIDTVKKIKISKYKGENVNHVASLIRSVHQRLSNADNVPDDFDKWVLGIMQTSSIPKFNELFTHMELQVTATSLTTRSRTKRYPNFDTILDAAEQTYLEYNALNLWKGNNKNNKSILVAQGAPSTVDQKTCWNCGTAGHTLDKCSKPRNQTEIEKRRKATRSSSRSRSGTANNSTSSAPRGKFRPPTPAEKNKRIIDGVHMYWASRAKKWVPDKNHAPAASALVTVPTAVQSSASSVPSTITTATTAEKTAALHNCVHSVNLAFQNLTTMLSDRS